MNNFHKGSRAWISQARGRTLLRKRLGRSRGQKLKLLHGNTKGKHRCLKRRKKLPKNRKRRGISCEKSKVTAVVQTFKVEEKCPEKEVQRSTKKRNIKRGRKRDCGGSCKRCERKVSRNRKGTKRSGNTKVFARAQKEKRKRCRKQKRQTNMGKITSMSKGKGTQEKLGQQKGTRGIRDRRRNVKRKRTRKGRWNFRAPVRNTFSWAPGMGSRDQFSQKPWEQRLQQPWQPKRQQSWQKPWQEPWQPHWKQPWQQLWQPNSQQPWQTTPKYQPLTPGFQALAPTLGPPNLPTSELQASQGEGGGGGGSSNGIDLNKAQ